MAPFVEEDDPTAIPVPPTRPSTPTLEHRLNRIAEAPSRAEPAVLYVETSSPIQAPPAPMAFATNGNSTTNGHENGIEDSDQNGSQETTVSFKSCTFVLGFTSPAFNASILLRITGWSFQPISMLTLCSLFFISSPNWFFES